MPGRSFEPAALALVSPLLASLAAAFDRRRRALAYRTERFELTSEIEADGHERLNVDALTGRTQVRSSFWDDGSVWFRACHPGPSGTGGWEFMLCFSGEINDIDCDELVEMFERSQESAHGKDPQRHSQDILSHWKRVNPTVERGAG